MKVYMKELSLEKCKTKAAQIIKDLESISYLMPLPMSFLIKQEYGNDPFLILISCLLSLRSRDTVTYPICIELFKKAKTPQQLLKIPPRDLERIIHPLGFYKNKARILHEV